MRKIITTLLLLVCGIYVQQAAATPTVKVKFDAVTITSTQVTLVISPVDPSVSAMPFDVMKLYGVDGESDDAKEIKGTKLDNRRTQFTFEYKELKLDDQDLENNRLFFNFTNNKDEWAKVSGSEQYPDDLKVGGTKFTYEDELDSNGRPMKRGCFYFQLGPYINTIPNVVIK